MPYFVYLCCIYFFLHCSHSVDSKRKNTAHMTLNTQKAKNESVCDTFSAVSQTLSLVKWCCDTLIFCNNSSVSACSSLCAVNHISFMMKLWRMCSILWGVVVWQLDKPPSWPLCVCSCMRTCLHLRWCAISLNKRCPLWSGQYRHTAYACLHGTITSVRLTTPL